MRDVPRNVKNYTVQGVPDGCHNCKKRYLGMVREGSHLPILGCSLACLDPENPCWCDEVDSFGKCDSYEKGDPPERVRKAPHFRIKK